MKADLFLVREWAGMQKRRYWATIRWGGEYGCCLDCDPAPTRKEAERIGREYAKKLGLTLPRPRRT